VQIKNIDIIDLNTLTEKDAIADGVDTLDQLFNFFKSEYGDDFKSQRFCKISWDELNSVTKKITQTNIDWFKEAKKELYSINAFIPIHGGDCCFYSCVYCYAKKLFKRFTDNFTLGINESRLNGLQNINGNVFMNSMTDLFHPKILSCIISYIIKYAHSKNSNHCHLLYLTKNPARYAEFISILNQDDFIGITFETNSYEAQDEEEIIMGQSLKITDAPTPKARFDAFKELKFENKFLSIEPIMEFDLDELLYAIRIIKPKFIFIGANSSRQNYLIEPEAEEIHALIDACKAMSIEVYKKQNLNRLLISNEKKII